MCGQWLDICGKIRDLNRCQLSRKIFFCQSVLIYANFDLLIFLPSLLKCKSTSSARTCSKCLHHVQENLQEISLVPMSSGCHSASFSFFRKQVELAGQGCCFSVKYWGMMAPISQVKYSTKLKETVQHLKCLSKYTCLLISQMQSENATMAQWHRAEVSAARE